jgi:hypothetical protein
LRFSCPYLAGDVELTEERERHIGERHPELRPSLRDCARVTLADPDEIRRSARSSNTRLFSRWFDKILGGKHTVVVVVSDAAPKRHWVVTAYLLTRLGQGGVEWKRN